MIDRIDTVCCFVHIYPVTKRGNDIGGCTKGERFRASMNSFHVGGNEQPRRVNTN